MTSKRPLTGMIATRGGNLARITFFNRVTTTRHTSSAAPGQFQNIERYGTAIADWLLNY